jgi:hypothetical protein
VTATEHEPIKTPMHSISNWSLASQFMVSEFEKYLSDSKDITKKLNLIARKTDINVKTLKRILSRQNEPSFATIVRILRITLQCNTEIQILEKMPAPVADEFKKNYGHRLSQDSRQKAVDQSIFNKNPIALEIYLRIAAQSFDQKIFKDRFGSYGEDVLKKLCTLNFIEEHEPSIYKVGSVVPEFSPEMVIQSGSICLENFVDFETGFEKGKHYASFYMEKLSPEGFRRWIEIQKSSVRAQVELLKNPDYLGDIPTFSFSIIDSVK